MGGKHRGGNLVDKSHSREKCLGKASGPITSGADWDLWSAQGHDQQEIASSGNDSMENGITCLSMALAESKKKNPKEKCGFIKYEQHSLQPWTNLLWLLPHKMGLYKIKGVLEQILTGGKPPRPSSTSRIPVPLLPELSSQVKSTTMSLEDVLGIVLRITS